MNTVVFFCSLIKHFRIYRSDKRKPTYQAIQSDESDAQRVLIKRVLKKLK